MVDPKLCEEAKRRLLAGAKPGVLYKELGISRDKAFRLRDELGLPKRAWNYPALPNATNLIFERNMKQRVNLLRGKAKKQNIPFEISHKDLSSLFEKQKGLCFYTDQPMVWNRSEGHTRKALTVDRIDGTKGYVAGNIVLCSWRANAIKNDLTIDELRQWIPSWWKRLQELTS
jgi:hypothetical protein